MVQFFMYLDVNISDDKNNFSFFFFMIILCCVVVCIFLSFILIYLNLYYITEYIKGLHIDEAYTIENKQISDELKLPPVKLHCSMLATDAIQSAIEDYINKNNRTNLNF